jgi:1-acyl-sn-glycerol-3-phosphate acyltransferase
MIRNLRAARRAALGIGLAGVLLPLLALQGFVVGPIFRNHNTIPNFAYNSARKLFGIKIEFNKKSAPIENKKPTWYVANHMSVADFLVVGSKLKGTFAGKGDILNIPGVSQMARAAKYIGIYRVPKKDPRFKKFHKMTIGKIANNFNKGHNTIMFPEGTTTDGSIVAQFRAGLISMLFDAEGIDKKGRPVKLEKDVVVQPVAIRVKEVEGKDIKSREDLRRFYSHYNNKDTLKRIWTRLATRTMTIEMTVFPTMDPKDYKDQFDLINKAGELVRKEVAPDQKIVEPAKIPDVDVDKNTDKNENKKENGNKKPPEGAPPTPGGMK